MIKLAVIIPTFNRVDYLKALLTQIAEINQSNFDIDTIVVVDGSTDGTLKMLKDYFPKAHIVSGFGNWWYTRSINEGINYANIVNPDYILTLNDDIKLKEDFFIKLNKAVMEAPNSIVGAIAYTESLPKKILSGGVKNIIWWRHKLVPYYKMFSGVDSKTLKGLHKSLVLPGRGMLIPYKATKELKGFDTKFAQYHSDFDFCLRAKKNGYKVFVSWDLEVFSYIEETGAGTSYLKTPFKTFIKGFFNKYSRINLRDNARYLFRHGYKILFPLTYMIFILSCFKAYFFNKKING